MYTPRTFSESIYEICFLLFSFLLVWAGCDNQPGIAEKAMKETVMPVPATPEEVIWHVKAFLPEGKLLDIKALDKEGHIYDVKAFQKEGNLHLMDIKALVDGKKLPVKMLVSDDKYIPVKAIGEDGTIYDIKALKQMGNAWM